jgi:crossover junction endodeoxyribonuclease RuvC
MIALGFDPGTRRAGYAVVREEKGKLELLCAGLLKAEAKEEHVMLSELSANVGRLAEEYHPDVIGIERLFFAKNQKTAIAVAQGRGVILSAAAQCGAQVLEYSPNEVKLQITGSGGADKKAVEKMVRLILRQPKLSLIDDAMDAAAIALCALRSAKFR